jgi:acetyl-CoA carboxylase biotin carboxyl carrier protein
MEKLIEKAMNLMQYADRYGVEEVLLVEGDQKIHFGRNLGAVSQPVPQVQNVCPPEPSVAVRQERENTGNHEALKRPESSKLKTVVSPMAGTFYCSPSPGSEPFAPRGKNIQEGDVVCIVEAMKIMNQIKSSHSGVIRNILVEDASPVSKGQVLFELE